MVGVRKVWQEDEKETKEGCDCSAGVAALDKDGNLKVCESQQNLVQWTEAVTSQSFTMDQRAEWFSTSESS